ncbi:uncharacterized protein EV422DRAFT_140599 [Fimicolochytrium jonesii]|uniref:uncharacterized protein n=1 Tax=Fimicolochytrium jonesii TaxID=1396493 RepID=UPI0022FE49DB|nr:uncharacterized protein EV422DRAFT_140599 [Fimicolochytrium jonesii]KAI8825779.1 hypothetical protein EV422DRAFT_140599 [Fimicolochytrium jonesii]
MAAEQYEARQRHTEAVSYPFQRSQSDPMLSMPRSAYPLSPSDLFLPQYPIPPPSQFGGNNSQQQMSHLSLLGSSQLLQFRSQESAENMQVDSPFSTNHPNHHLFGSGGTEYVDYSSSGYQNAGSRKGSNESINSTTGFNVHASGYQPSPTGTGLPSLPTPVFNTFEDILGAHFQQQQQQKYLQYKKQQRQNKQLEQQQQQQQNSQKQPTYSRVFVKLSEPPRRNDGQQGHRLAPLPTPPFSASSSTHSGGDPSHYRHPPTLPYPTSPVTTNMYTIHSGGPGQYGAVSEEEETFAGNGDEHQTSYHQTGYGQAGENNPPTDNLTETYHPDEPSFTERMFQYANAPLGVPLSDAPAHNPPHRVMDDNIPQPQPNQRAAKSAPRHQHQRAISSPIPKTSVPTSQLPVAKQGTPTGPRIYRCFVKDCTKTYGTGAGLRYHLRNFHKMASIPRQPPVRVARTKPDFYACPKCPKQYSTAAGLRYHKKTFTHPEDVEGIVAPALANGSPAGSVGLPESEIGDFSGEEDVGSESAGMEGVDEYEDDGMEVGLNFP